MDLGSFDCSTFQQKEKAWRKKQASSWSLSWSATLPGSWSIQLLLPHNLFSHFRILITANTAVRPEGGLSIAYLTWALFLLLWCYCGCFLNSFYIFPPGLQGPHSGVPWSESVFVVVPAQENLDQPAKPSALRTSVEHFKWEKWLPSVVHLFIRSPISTALSRGGNPSSWLSDRPSLVNQEEVVNLLIESPTSFVQLREYGLQAPLLAGLPQPPA